jgi:menaquinone-dependent protoporphyrinogen oxidase
MKTCIIYASKYGYTEEMVLKMVKESNNEFVSFNINMNSQIDLSNFDAVILGSSIYIGQINAKMKRFIKANIDVLLTKKLGLFLSCGSEENFDNQVKSNFGEILFNHSSSTIYLGGMIKKERLNFLHKFIISNLEKSADGLKPYKTYPNRTLDIVNQFYRA